MLTRHRTVHFTDIGVIKLIFFYDLCKYFAKIFHFYPIREDAQYGKYP